jgi:hypothetical protein
VMWVMWNLASVYLETVLVSVQDRCTVCAIRTIGFKTILDEANGTPRWRGSIGNLFGSVWRLCYSHHEIGARVLPNVP